jgi:hypothetical protein
MFTLQLLPKLNELDQPHPQPAQPTSPRSVSPQRDIVTPPPTGLTGWLQKLNQRRSDSVARPLSPEEEQMVQILLEQISQVNTSLKEATTERRWDDVVMLKRHLAELEAEIRKLMNRR